MFKSQNFCHIASNNRNQVKVGVFVYRTTDDLATVLTSGYFNDRIIDINLHDLIIHEKVDNADATKVQRNLLCVTERTLENVGTLVIKSKWEGDIEQAIADLQTYVDNNFVKLDGTSVMTGPLKFRAGSMRGAVAPYLNGVSFWKLDSQGNITNIANITDSQFYPVTTNSIDLGNTTHTWKDAYISRVITAVINNGYDIAVPVTNSADTLALKSEVDLAANSGRMITDQGVWYAKMYAATVAPAAENGTNYADFSQVDTGGNPIIVLYERQNGAWVETDIIVPPAEYDGYVPITSKIWDIVEQTGQQGGRILWNHQSKDFTAYPQIISFENAALTGVSTAPTPTSASPDDQIANKEYVDNATAGNGYHPDILDWKWADHEVNDTQWLSGDTFSWQDGTAYEAAYQHLVDDIDNIKQSTAEYVVLNVGSYLRQPLLDATGGTYPCPYAYIATAGSPSVVYAASSSLSVGTYVYDGYGSGATVLGMVSSISYGSYPIPMVETVAGTEIIFYTAQDGHKIVYSNQENNVAAIYTATGVSWYYILDTLNQRFKLPRAKHNKYTTSLGVVGNGKSLGFTNGSNTYGTRIVVGASNASALGFSTQTVNATVGSTSGNYDTTNDSKVFGITTDESKSGLITTSIAQDTDQYKYLYFYVGNFTQTALENTAGLNASLFNNKADLDLANVLANIDYVVESQLPTADNNYTWYRKYRSGWVEQGGYIAKGAAQANTVTFSIPFAAKDYIPTVTGDWTGNTGAACSVDWSAATTTQMVVTKDGTAMGAFWEVKGMAA